MKGHILTKTEKLRQRAEIRFRSYEQEKFKKWMIEEPKIKIYINKG